MYSRLFLGSIPNNICEISRKASTDFFEGMLMTIFKIYTSGKVQKELKVLKNFPRMHLRIFFEKYVLRKSLKDIKAKCRFLKFFFLYLRKLGNHPIQFSSRINLKSRNSLSRKVEKICYLPTHSFFSMDGEWTNSSEDRREKIKSWNSCSWR